MKNASVALTLLALLALGGLLYSQVYGAYEGPEERWDLRWGHVAEGTGLYRNVAVDGQLEVSVLPGVVLDLRGAVAVRGTRLFSSRDADGGSPFSVGASMGVRTPGGSALAFCMGSGLATARQLLASYEPLMERAVSSVWRAQEGHLHYRDPPTI